MTMTIFDGLENAKTFFGIEFDHQIYEVINVPTANYMEEWTLKIRTVWEFFGRENLCLFNRSLC